MAALEAHHQRLKQSLECILRPKSDFASTFKTITPVQMSRKKDFAWRVGQITSILLRNPPHEEGRIAIVTNVEVGGGGRIGVEHDHHADDNGETHGQVAWS